jgi:hypothetical protein
MLCPWWNASRTFCLTDSTPPLADGRFEYGGLCLFRGNKLELGIVAGKAIGELCPLDNGLAFEQRDNIEVIKAVVQNELSWQGLSG